MSYLEIELSFVSPDSTGTAESFEAFVDCVLDELAAIGREEVDVVASLASFSAVFVERVDDDADDFTNVTSFMNDLRTALHAADCGTSKWPDYAHFRGASSRNGDMVPA